MLNSEENRLLVTSVFPKLVDDPDFIISDKADPNYNCIAWAAIVTNTWWWPIPEDKRPIKHFDGVTYDWPFGAVNNTKLETFIGVFSKKGYEVCDNGDYEIGFRKICLYGHDTDNVTHAARQFTVKPDIGKWTSKLGKGFRITHGTAYTIESVKYGKVLQFMKCPWP